MLLATHWAAANINRPTQSELPGYLKMSLHFKDTPYCSGLPLVTVTNWITKPQDKFPFCKMVGVDEDGKTIKVFDLKTELDDKYFVIFFFPMDFTIDYQEVTSFSKSLSDFDADNCQVFLNTP